MDRATVDVYEVRGERWAAQRRPVRQRRADARALAGALPAGRPRVDLGCGAGRFAGVLGRPVVGLDAARAMLAQCRRRAPGALLVQGDLEALPFADKAFAGAWANMSYLHVPSVRLPRALADLHRALEVGAPLDIQVMGGDYEGRALPQDDLGGRYFAGWTPPRLVDVLEGAGFAVTGIDAHGDVVRATARRARTLADVVGPGMTMLVVGLNPSVYAADAGVGFARPGNRFWPAARAAGVADVERDAWRALRDHGMGMTDLVKRATPGAAELRADEYRAGMARVERLVAWLAPAVVCFVGLAGWRRAVDPRAGAGTQVRRLGGRPVYLMPSTSGANAHARLDALTDHLRRARHVGEGR
ncbi:MAG TPA: methyltransferase domain-containing protein [Acidimicrobiales bacterium]|nr:methyltransferase domain-containing protein [Acidimicrobiales bacterium]